MVIGCAVLGFGLAACSHEPPAIVEATDQAVVIRDVPFSDQSIMQEKADQICGVNKKKAVYIGSSCASMLCSVYHYTFECR